MTVFLKYYLLRSVKFLILQALLARWLRSEFKSLIKMYSRAIHTEQNKSKRVFTVLDKNRVLSCSYLSRVLKKVQEG